VFGDFFLLEREGESPVRGERLAFGETSGRNEAWLRDTLFRHPEVLPIRELDPAYGPLTPLCTELGTEAGPLDAAFINPHGRLTLVECKLWRNPEARRKVVAQVLDYARAITRWSYADLQRRVAMATGQKGNVPFELVRRSAPELSEHQFVDATAAAMRSGRFLLLIAGDGIREDVGAMAELVNRNASSGFSFGLIEVALYGMPDGALAIQPRTVAKTTVIERSVVVLRDPTGAPVPGEVEVESSAADTVSNALGEGGKQAAYREWWKPILDMAFDDPDQERPRLHYPNNVRLPLPWPNTWILGAGLAATGGYQVCLIEGGAAASKTLGPLLELRQEQILSQLPKGAALKRGKSGDSFFSTEILKSSFANDDQARAWLKEQLNGYVNVFRPLLKALKAER
jgi:hypothetical protein